VTLPVTIDGAVNTNTDRDDFRVRLEAGQRVTFAFRSQSLGGSVRPALTVFGPDGREQLHDPGGVAEPTLDFIVPEGSDYRVRVEDRAYTRDASSFYRLAIFTGPRLVAAFPSVLTRGRPQEVTLFGYQLPGGAAAGSPFAPGLEQIQVTVDAPETGDLDGGGWMLTNAAMLDGFSYDPPGTYGRLRFELVDAEVTRETDAPHQTLANAQKIEPGAVIAGRFLRRGEVDWYRFSAKKGQRLEIETVGERAGLVMDLDVAILDAKGKLLTTIADTAQPRGAPAQCPLDTLDPIGSWTVPADGDYLLVIRDLYGPVLAGVERTYRLAIAPRREEARVVALAAGGTQPHGLSVAPGGEARLRLVAIRRGDHKKPITVRAEGLPSGLSAEAATIAANQLSAVLTIKAAHDTDAWAGLLTLRAETELDGQSRSFPAIGATLVRAGRPPQVPAVVRRTEGIALAVTGGKAKGKP
jgi:hypothetical protein